MESFVLVEGLKVVLVGHVKKLQFSQHIRKALFSDLFKTFPIAGLGLLLIDVEDLAYCDFLGVLGVCAHLLVSKIFLLQF